MTVFLLGANGFIGRHLYKRLSEDHTVVTDMRYFDERFDVIINLAAVTHTFNIFDPQLIESNIILADRIFKRPERIIYASSCSAAHFTNPYAMSKQYCEYRGQRHGNAIGLRIFNCYGPGNQKGVVKFLMDKKDGDMITVRGPELVRDYIHVDDVVDSIQSALYWSSPSKVVEVGTGIPTQTMDLVNTFMKVTGRSFDISIVEAGDHEPKEMVAKEKSFCIGLEEGLSKTIHG